MTTRLRNLQNIFGCPARLALLLATLTVLLPSCQTSEQPATAESGQATSDERYRRHLDQEEKRATQQSADLLGARDL